MHEHAHINVVAPAAPMQHQLMKGRRARGAFEFGDVGADRHIQPDLALFREQQKQQTGEVLARGADAHACLRPQGDARLQARHAEAASVDRLAVLAHANNDTWGVALVPGLEQFIQLAMDRCRFIHGSHRIGPSQQRSISSSRTQDGGFVRS